MRLILSYSYIKGNKLKEGRLVATFQNKKEKDEFLASPEAKMWSDYYMGAKYI